MKKLFIAPLLMGGLVLVTAHTAFATATASTNVTTMSADNAATGGSGAYTAVTGPVLTEGSNRDITNGTIILTVSTNFQFNTGATVSVAVTRGSGTSNLVGLSSGIATVTTSNITITVTNQDGLPVTTSILTWSGIQVRPLLGTPLATNTITMSTASTANILGITKGTTSFGQLRETLGAANKLTYTTAPAATNTAGVALTNVVVQIQDRFGNTVSSNNVTVALALNTGAFASGNTNANTGASGSATFSNLVIDTAGSYSLTAAAAATTLSNSPPSAFIVLPAAPNTIQITQDAPSSITAGVQFSSPVTVQLTDPFGNLVSNKTVMLSLLGGGTLSGTTSQPSDGNGVATFSGLSVAQVGSYSLIATTTNSLSVTGANFTVTAGFASQLGYTIAPSAVTTAGVTMASVVVQIQDQTGNSIASNGVPITVTLNTGAFTTGTTTIPTGPDGSATFGDLLIDTSGNYTLTASAAGTTFTPTAAAPFTIAPATPSVIQITQDAPASTTAGTVFSPAVTVLVTDSLNNPLTNTTVTLSLLNGGTLNGTLSQATAVNGVASFTNLNITVAGANYALIATSVNSLSVTGNTFVVTTATASKLVYTSVPATTNVAGSTLSSFTVQITDPFGNSIPTNGVPITASLNSGTFASGTTPVNSAPNGSATFSDLVITNAGNNTLTASAAGLTSANSTLVILPTAYAITFQQDAPSPATAGVTFSPPVAVKIADLYNNVLANRPVTLSLLTGSGLNGSLVRTTAVNGVASFTNLTINAAGTNYALVASSTNSLSVTGNTFAVTTAPASKLVFTSVPAITNLAGSQLSSFGIQIQDPFNNNIPTNGVLITMTLSNGTFASGTTATNSDLNGSATISNLVITNAGNNTVTASATGLTSTNKPLVILPAPYTITFQQDAPSVTNAGATFTPPVAVKIADLYNNALTNRPVTLSLLNGSGLNGSLVRTTAVNGVASFTNLTINAAGTNYALVASSTNSLSVTGNTFTVTAAPASKLIYTVLPPASTVAGATLTPFTVQIADQFNNSIATNGVLISMSLSNSAFASGTTSSNSDVNGSASFSDLVITNAGNRILVASAPGLTSTNRAITIAPDVANGTLAFVQGPAANISAGAVFTNTVQLVDEFNNGISNATVTLSPNGFATLNGTLSRATAGNGVASFTNLSVNTAGSNYFITATSGSLSTNSSLFNVTAGAIARYVVTATTPQTRGLAFGVTVTAQDVASNTIPDSSTVVTMSGSTANVLFDGSGDSSFTNNTHVLSNGTFTISTEDNIPETITITATDGNGKTGTSPAIIINAAAGDYRSFQTGPWNTAGTWQIWDGANWVTASIPPAGGAGTNITIQNTHRVTNNVAVALSGTLITQGSGTLTFSSGGSISVGSGGLVLNSGAVTNSSASTLIFNSGSTYQHSFTTTAGTIPIATWNINSTCEVIGYTTLDNSGGTPVIGNITQSFGNFTWNCLSQSGTITFLGALNTVNGNFTLVSSGTGSVRLGNNALGNLAIGGNYSQTGGSFQLTGNSNRVMTVAGNFSLSGGTFDMTAVGNATLNVAGNFTHTGGTLTESDASSPFAVVVFNGTGIQNYTSGGTVSGTVDFNVSNNATLFLGTNLLGSGSTGTFTLSAGGTLGIGDPLGITTSGASGNIRVSGTRTYNIGANYIYNGPASQVTSNGLPATVNSLTVSNSGGIVTLGSNVSVTSNLTVSAGVFDLGNFTANRASNGGTITVANSAALKIGGTNTFPTNYLNRVLGASSTVEYEGSAQSVPALAYGSLATSGSGIKTLLAGSTTLAGDLNIGAGTTFAAGINSFSIAGNLTNNGTAFTFTGPQTITFTGSGTQNVSGSSPTAFNTFAIGSTSVINLDNNDTALEFTIAGLDQAGGTWGSTTSGAANPDDTNFLGTGTLNVTPPTFGISFTQDAPAVTNAGAVFSPAVTVQLTSSATNLIANQTVTLTLNGGGTLNGTLSGLTDTNGLATFSNLSINVAGTDYSLTATITSLSLSVTGNTFVVTTATASKLVYTSVPATTNVAGSTLSSFTVQITDPFGNSIPTNGVPITASLNSGTFASGTTPVNSAPNGSATFSDLVITNAGNNTLTASAAGLTSANSTLVILPTAYAITFQQDAPSPATAGVTFSPPVAVKIADLYNNVLANRPVTLSLLTGSGLNGSLVRTTAVNGVASFTNLTINAAGTNYALVASSTNSLSVTGNTFAVTTAPASKLVFTSVPAITNLAGSQLSSFGIQIQDPFNNNIPTNGVLITMTLSNGTFASGTTATNSDLNGSATISNLVITNAGNNTVTASATGLTSTNKPLVILPAPYTITFQQDAPSVTNAGATFTPPVAVKIADLYNNALTNRPVTLSLLNGSGLNGSLVRTTAVNGVASFTNLTINAAGTNYALVASSTNSLSVTGNTFTVTAAPASKLIYTVLPPASTVAGATLTPFTVQIADQFNNSIATNGVLISMSLSNSAFASGTTSSNSDVNGSASFSDLVITNAGNRILVASAPGLTSTNRAITIAPDVANGTLAFVQGPAANISAGAVFTNTVQLVDEFNNGISNATVTLSPNGFATLNGTLSRATAGNGVASFTNLSVNTAGSNYFITATSGSLSTNSSLFNVTAGAIARYVVTATTPQTRGLAFGVTVTAQDVASNTIPDSSTVVTMSGSTANVLFDGSGDSSFTNNTHVLSNGTFTISTEDNIPETITITATDGNGKTGTSPAIIINAAAGDYRSFQTGPWNTAGTWQIWDGANWVTASIPPAGGAGTNITIQNTHRVTNNVAVALSGTLITQGSGTLTFSSGGSISVGSGGLVLNSGAVTNSSASTLIFNSGSTYQHGRDGGTIPTAAYNSNSLLQVTGITATVAKLPTNGVNGNVEWNCPNQTALGAVILAVAANATQSIGGDFTVASTGTGSIIDGGGSNRNLRVGGNLNVYGGAYSALGGDGFSVGTVTVSVARSLIVSGGAFSLVIGGNTTNAPSGVLTVGGDLAVSGGNLTILTGTAMVSSAVSSMTVSGNTSVTGGILNLTDATSGNPTGVIANLKGNLTISGGTISRGGSLPATVNFAGTSPQTYSKPAGTITGAVNFAILSGATVNFGTSLLDGSSGTFTLNSGGTMGIGDPLGITTSGASGNIRVSGTRTYNTGANYIYNGPASQVTSNGLPATVNSLTVSNTGGIVTLGANVSVTSNLTVSAGVFDLGNFTANRASNGGTITVANGAALNIGGANPFPSNYATVALGPSSTVQYEGSAQNVLALPYGSLATSGSGIKTLLAGPTTLAGDLNIGAGTTFAAGTNSFSIAGGWSNNGNGFTATNSQTVTFNGSSPQTIDGSLATAFNNVAINSGSVLNLAINGSTAQFLTIAGVNQPAGTWGATGSGAANIDNVDFQGSGTLNVLSALTVPSTTTLTTSGSPSTYGQSVTFTASVTGTGPTPSGTVTFMAGADTLGTQVVSGSPTATAAFVTSGLLPGSYTITTVYGGDANFLASSNTVAQQVNLGPITVTANSTTKTYGQTVTFAGTEFSTSGTLVGGDSVTSVTLTSDGAPAGAATGNHTITPSAAVGTGLTNYIISYQNGTLTVNQAPVTGSITASNKVYDGTTAATIASYGLSVVIGTDDVTLTGGTANFSDGTVGNGKTVTATGLTLAGFTAGNYFLTSSNASTTADITPAALTIIADNKTKTAGLPNPTLTATYVGFVNGDNTNALTTPPTLSTTATDSSPAGTYSITASDAVATNYTISYTDGTLTVAEVPQITDTKVSGNQFIFSFPTLTNEEYQVEFKDDLSAPTWTSLGSLIDGTGSSVTVTNAITGSKRFYRVEVSPGN